MIFFAERSRNLLAWTFSSIMPASPGRAADRSISNSQTRRSMSGAKFSIPISTALSCAAGKRSRSCDRSARRDYQYFFASGQEGQAATQVAYSAGKFGVEGLTQVLALENEAHDIRVIVWTRAGSSPLKR